MLGHTVGKSRSPEQPGMERWPQSDIHKQMLGRAEHHPDAEGGTS